MAVDTSIAQNIYKPQFQTPMDALGKTTSIFDMLAQIQQRQAEAADYQAQAPVRQAEATAKIQKLAEENVLKQAENAAQKYNQDTEDVDFDDPKAYQVLDNSVIPGVGSAGYLRGQYLARKGAQITATRNQAITELDQHKKLVNAEADPIETFQASDKTDEDYQALKPNLLAVNKAKYGKLLGPTYNPATMDAVFNQAVKTAQDTKDIHEKLLDKQAHEKLELSTPEGRSKALSAEKAAYTKENGKPPDQETQDAMLEAIYERADTKGIKVARKTPGRAQQIAHVFGDHITDPEPKDENGKPVTDLSHEAEYNVMRHLDGSVHYERTDKTAAGPKPTEDEQIANLGVKIAKGTATPDEKLLHDELLKAKTAGQVAGATIRVEGTAANQQTQASRKEVAEKYNDLTGAQKLYKAMQAAKSDAEQAEKSGGNVGAADMALVSNHMNMTVGAIKGARTGRDIIEAHMKARSWPEDISVAAKSVLNGQKLSPQQRQMFLKLAQDRLNEFYEDYDQAKSVWDYAPPGDKTLDRSMYTGGTPSPANRPPLNSFEKK